MLPKLKYGDVILSRSDTWVSKTIRWFGRYKTGSARVSHASMFIKDLKNDAEEVVESLWKVSVSPLAKYEKQGILVYRPKKIELESRIRICVHALSVEERSYGVTKIPLFALDSLFHTYWFTTTLGISNFKVCSNLIAWAYKREIPMRTFGVNWRSVQPDTIDDYCKAHPDEWELVYDSLKERTEI